MQLVFGSQHFVQPSEALRARTRSCLGPTAGPWLQAS